ncbi:MAG TPA: cytochrome c [Candidatus Baltobacteraceae bacterium]|nr:cytochrome c [Candidatus Baltobacteraceae bacterium]
MKLRSSLAAVAAAAVIFGGLLWFAPPGGVQPAQAYPIFSQALGVKCSMCHTMVPELNSYGRYLQRTFYAPITQPALKKTLPAFLWYQFAGNNVGNERGAVNPHTKDFLTSTLYLYFVGLMGAGSDFSYRVENPLVTNDVAVNQSTGPETMWAAYNDLFHGKGHLQAGMDYPGPVPAFVANPSDYENYFELRHLTIGTHGYNLINKRLTFRFNYEDGPIDLEVAWRGGTNNPIAGGASDFAIAPGDDKTFPQWKVAYAPPGQPFEIGAFGSAGTYYTKLRFTPADAYYNYGPYFQLDPGWIGKSTPGVMFFFQRGHDSNPGTTTFGMIAPGGPYYTDGAVELMEPVFKGAAVVTVRNEFISNGLGVSTQYWSTGTSFQPFPDMLPWMFGRFGILMDGYSSAPHGLGTYQWALQFEPPLSGPLTFPFKRVKAGSSAAVAQAQASPAPPPSGASLYAQNCQACHRSNGVGTPPMFPSLVNDAMVTPDDPTALIIVVKKGIGEMPAYADRLSDAQIAAILTYVRGSWGNHAAPVTADQVSAIK